MGEIIDKRSLKTLKDLIDSISKLETKDIESFFNRIEITPVINVGTLKASGQLDRVLGLIYKRIHENPLLTIPTDDLSIRLTDIEMILGFKELIDALNFIHSNELPIEYCDANGSEVALFLRNCYGIPVGLFGEISGGSIAIYEVEMFKELSNINRYL